MATLIVAMSIYCANRMAYADSTPADGSTAKRGKRGHLPSAPWMAAIARSVSSTAQLRPDVVPESEFVQVALQVIFAAVLVDADHAAHEDTKAVNSPRSGVKFKPVAMPVAFQRQISPPHPRPRVLCARQVP
jgi:hypothetical protein